jgi:hypothetical protein
LIGFSAIGAPSLIQIKRADERIAGAAGLIRPMVDADQSLHSQFLNN